MHKLFGTAGLITDFILLTAARDSKLLFCELYIMKKQDLSDSIFLFVPKNVVKCQTFYEFRLSIVCKHGVNDPIV